VDGQVSDQTAYDQAAAVYTQAQDLGYEAQGVFLWNDMSVYDTTYDGLMAMAQAAVESYVPLDETLFS
jgi:hypothetical protein